jgi:hypothetical protein
MPMVGFESVPAEDVLIRVLRKFRFKNLQKIPFGEGQVQDPILALPGHGSGRTLAKHIVPLFKSSAL